VATYTSPTATPIKPAAANASGRRLDGAASGVASRSPTSWVLWVGAVTTATVLAGVTAPSLAATGRAAARLCEPGVVSTASHSPEAPASAAPPGPLGSSRREGRETGTPAASANAWARSIAEPKRFSGS
jgi:hypothetical protein